MKGEEEKREVSAGGGGCHAKPIRAREGKRLKRAQTEKQGRKTAKEGKDEGKKGKKERERERRMRRERARRAERSASGNGGSALRSACKSAPAFADGRRRGALWK